MLWFIIIRARGLDPDRDHRSFDRTRTLDRTRSVARALAFDRTRVVARAPDPKLARAVAHTLADALERALELNLYPQLALDPDRTLSLARALDPDHVLARDIERALALAPDLLDPVRALALVRPRARNLNEHRRTQFELRAELIDYWKTMLPAVRSRSQSNLQFLIDRLQLLNDRLEGKAEPVEAIALLRRERART